MPGKTRLDQLFTQISTIHKDPRNGPSIAVLADGFNLDGLSKNHIGGELFGLGPKCLVFFGAIDAIQSDFDGLFFLQDCYRVAVRNPHNLATPSQNHCWQKQQEQESYRRVFLETFTATHLTIHHIFEIQSSLKKTAVLALLQKSSSCVNLQIKVLFRC
jgi:hypothetical protein